jgi:hypothetical protein
MRRCHQRAQDLAVLESLKPREFELAIDGGAGELKDRAALAFAEPEVAQLGHATATARPAGRETGAASPSQGSPPRPAG